MPDVRNVSFSDLVDEAIDKLPLVRRKLVKRRMNNAAYREELCASCMSHCMSAMPSFAVQAGDADEFTAFSLDLTTIDKLLELIVKYLPTIIDLILKFL
jgi:hypothetical protein